MNPQQIIAEVLEHAKGMWRFRWWAVGVAWLVSLVGWGYSYSVPDVYQASARVYVDTNSLLRPLMAGLTAQQNTMTEVQLVSTAVLARPNLESVARQTGLDLRTSTPGEFEELITGLQTGIIVSGGRDNIFRIQYEDTSRETARDVVAAIYATFVEDAIGAQGTDADISEQALASEIAEHEQRLNDAETALAEFRKRNLGYMPDESGGYYDRLQAALANVSGTEERIQLLARRRDELARQIDGEVPVFGIMPSARAASSCPQAAQLLELRSQLSQLLVDFTDKHPRVLTLKEQIAVLEQQCKMEAGRLGTVQSVATGGDSLSINPVYQNLRIQFSTAEVDLAEARGQLRSAQASVAALRRDVDKIAEVETQLQRLNRDYDVVQVRHQELLRRWEDLQAKKRLDPVTDDAQFRLIEPPFALAHPVRPNRPLLLGFVLVVALGAGGALAFGLNQVQPTFFSRRMVQRVSGLPVLGSVRLALTPAAAMHERRMTVAWAASLVLLFGATTAAIQYSSAAIDFMNRLLGAAS